MPELLLIEDDVVVLKALTRFLQKEGFRVDPAANGQEAFKKLEQNHYDLVITDLNMPLASGYEVMKRIRSLDRHIGIPVIVITSQVNEEAITQCYSIGADDFIRKPVMPQELHVRVKRLLGHFA